MNSVCCPKGRYGVVSISISSERMVRLEMSLSYLDLTQRSFWTMKDRSGVRLTHQSVQQELIWSVDAM